MSRLFLPLLALLAAAAPAAEPLRVYVLAGQSNMQGHAHLSTLDSMAGDPRLARSQEKAIGGWDYEKLCPGPLGTGTDWGDLLAASKTVGLR